MGTLEFAAGVEVPVDGEVPIEGVLLLDGWVALGVVEVELPMPVPPRPPVAAPDAGVELMVAPGLRLAAPPEVSGAVGSPPPPPLAP